MIEKLNLEEVNNPGEATLKAFSILNQLVDAVNELQLTVSKMENLEHLKKIGQGFKNLQDHRPNMVTDDPFGPHPNIYEQGRPADPYAEQRKALEQSEICCTEWEKQALDYKAENIALSGDLERTRKALDKAKWWLNEIVESHRCTPISTAEMALKEITALEQKDK